MKTLKVMGALAVLAMAGPAVALWAEAAQAQTRGMEHRGERRDTRQQARDTKHSCNASGSSSRSGCRQAKRETKQQGRRD